MKNMNFHRAKLMHSPPGTEMPIMTILYTRDFDVERSGRHWNRDDANKSLAKDGIHRPQDMEFGVEYYVTQRGFLRSGRQYRDFDQDEREQIIEDFLTHGSKFTRDKWKIDSSTLHHIRWHNKEAEEEIEDRHFAKAGL